MYAVIIRRANRLGYCADDVPTVADLFNTADDDFFHRVLKTKSNHVLQPGLPGASQLVSRHTRSTGQQPKFQ